MLRASLFILCLLLSSASYSEEPGDGLQIRLIWSDYREGYWKTFYLKEGRALLLAGLDAELENEISANWRVRDFSPGLEEEIEGALESVGVFGWLAKYPPDDGDKSAFTLCHGLDWELLVVRDGMEFKSEGSCEKAPGLFVLIQHVERMMASE